MLIETYAVDFFQKSNQISNHFEFLTKAFDFRSIDKEATEGITSYQYRKDLFEKLMVPRLNEKKGTHMQYMNYLNFNLANSDP